jgi:hypothetical protein
MTKSEDDELIEESRRALLKHYSSKSTLQATILLSLAVAFFAFIQTIPLSEKWNHWVLCLFYSTVLTAFIFLTARALGRLIAFGKKAGVVMKIHVIPEADLEKIIEKDGVTEEFDPTYLNRVEYSCGKFLEKSKVHVMFHTLTNERWGSIVCLLVLFLSFFTYFHLSDFYTIVVMFCILAFLALVVYLKGDIFESARLVCAKGAKRLEHWL